MISGNRSLLLEFHLNLHSTLNAKVAIKVPLAFNDLILEKEFGNNP